MRVVRLLIKAILPVLALSALVVNIGCKSEGESAEIVIPPGAELRFSTEEFLKFSDSNIEIKLRKAIDNETLQDMIDMTPSNEQLTEKTTDFRYVVPKSSASLNGIIVLDIVSKSNGLNWKAIVLDPAEVITPTLESTLLYDLIARYPNKSIKTYSKEELIQIRDYIKQFSVARQELFGITGQLSPGELYAFLRNGLGSNIEFLAMIDEMDLSFDYSPAGEILTMPFPWGRKNNQIVMDESRTTASGSVYGYETIRVDVKIQGRDPDGDRVFSYFEFLEDGSILKNEPEWSFTPSYTDSRPNPYQLRAFLSDGSMEPIALNWDIFIGDNNRPPRVQANCPTEVQEGSTWVCDLTGNDPDGDDLIRYVISNANFPYAQPRINGVTYVPGSQVEARDIRIEWTPTNRDFLKSKPVMVFQIVASDYTQTGVKKNGDDPKLFTVQLKGVNSKPYPIANGGGVYNWNTPVDDIPRVLDIRFDPGGPYDADTRTVNKRFHFEIVIADNDNVDGTDSNLFDINTLQVSGGADRIRAEPDDQTNFSREVRLVNGVNTAVTVFKYSWQPTAISPNATVSFVPSDDMENGKGAEFQIFLDSQPRTELPACTVTPTTTTLSSGFSVSPTSVLCDPRASPSIARLSINSIADAVNFVLHSKKTSGGSFITLARAVGSASYSVAEQNYGTMLSYSHYFTTQSAGVVRFSRSAVCDSANIPTTTISIPANTALTTTYSPGAPYVPRVRYLTGLAATIKPLECEVLVPVVATGRVASSGQISVIAPMNIAMIAKGLSVSNSGAVNYETDQTPTVRFSRTDSTGALIIPEGTTVRTNEAGGADSIVYIVPMDRQMDPGVSTLDVMVVREFSNGSVLTLNNPLAYFDLTSGKLTSAVPAGAGSGLAWSGAPIPGLSIENPGPLFPRSFFNIEAYKNTPAAPTMSGVYTFADGTTPTANDISVVTPSGLEPGVEGAPVAAARLQTEFSNVRVRNAAWSNPSDGYVEFYKAGPGADVTIPVGLVVSSADRRLYQTISSGTLVGSSSLVLAAQRLYETTYRPQSVTGTFTFRDGSFSISYVNFPNPLNILPNTETAFLIEVSDNLSNVLIPRDDLDRNYVKEYKVSSGPALAPAKVRMCREKVGGCTPCVRSPPSPPPATDPYVALSLGTLSHEASRKCYFRVTPDNGDVAKTYRYNINMCDYGQMGPSPESCTARDLQFYVLEANTQPYFTTAHNYGTNTPGAVIGSTTLPTVDAPTSTTQVIPTPFTEGQNRAYTVYAYDPNLDAGNKTLKFEILPQVYHLKPSDLGYRATPVNLKIDPASLVNTNHPSGAGNLARANLVWLPTDDEAKIFSSSEGFIVGIKVLDNATNLPISLNQILYIKVYLNNINNTPVLSSIGPAGNGNSYTIDADTYFTQTFTVFDADRASPVGGSFMTLLSACWNADGSRKANPYFDFGVSDPDVCHLTGPEWGADSFDPAYTGNIAVAQCRMGGSLKVDFAAPKITRTLGPVNVTGGVQSTFRIEWCPQKMHIGTYSLGVQTFDNGDLDVKNVLASRKGGYAPLYLNVRAPLFLTSPTPAKTIRQTAAGITAQPFTYQVIANNSKGNAMTYSIVSAPVACALPNGVCINSTTGLVTWTPDRSQITDGNPATNKKIVVRARDNVNGEISQGEISLWVQDPLIYPGEVGVSILSATPDPVGVHYADEMKAFPVTVVATDANIDDPNNHDILFARFYVDGKPIEDAEMTRIVGTDNWTVTFNYRPAANSGSIDQDGAGPILNGQHFLKVEVTDGNFIDARNWTVNVRNSMILPTLMLDIPAQRKSVEPSITFANYIWGAEAGAATTLTGKKYESLYISGSYQRAGVTKYYLWAMDVVNGVLTKTGSGNKWNYNENLNWGAITRRVATKTDAVTSVNDVFLTNQTGKYGTFTNSTNSLKVNGDLTRYSNPLPAALGCNGCAGGHFLNSGYGSFISIVFNGNRNFYGSGATLSWDSSPTGPQKIVPGWPAGYTVSGIAVNEATKRLFVSGTKGTNTENVVVVYDVSPTVLATPLDPIKLSEIDVSAQAGWSVQGQSLPSDIVVDSRNDRGRSSYRVFVYLRGVGGLVTFVDDGSTIPTTASINTIGVGQLPSSASDVLSTGFKLNYDIRSDLVVGTSREARVVYTIDPITFEVVAKPSPVSIDGLWVLQSGTEFLTDRTNSRVYSGQ